MAGSKDSRRQRRKKHIRKKLLGTAECPRLTVFKSLRYVYAQLVDDGAARTLVHVHSLSVKKGGGAKKAAGDVGAMIARRAVEKGIKRAAFDRNGYRYHGVIKEIADAARKEGLQF